MNIQGISQGGQVNFNVSEVKVEKPIKEIEVNGEISQKSLENLTGKLNSIINDNGVHAEYQVHDKFNDIMIKIVDDKTGDVISELPPKKILDMIAKFCEMAGIFVDKKA